MLDHGESETLHGAETALQFDVALSDDLRHINHNPTVIFYAPAVPTSESAHDLGYLVLDVGFGRPWRTGEVIVLPP
jgi:hypothetical protein